MRIYISADMEGISGVVHSEQTAPGAREYERACALMLGEVNVVSASAWVGAPTPATVDSPMTSSRRAGVGPATSPVVGPAAPGSRGALRRTARPWSTRSGASASEAVEAT